MTMSKEEREAFLAGARVGVLAVVADGAPLLAPIWYSYEPGGDVIVITDAAAQKTSLLRAAGRASMCVQTETAPYQYVVVEGPVTVTDGHDEELRGDMARRYLGDELGEMYLQATAETHAMSVTVSLTPERWRTTDFGKQWG